MADARLLNIFFGLCYSFLDLEAVELQALVGRVGHDTFLGVKALLAHVSTLDERNNGQVKMLGKSIVTAVMGRHRHDGTRAIASKHIVTYIYRYVLACDGIHGIAASEHATHLLLNHALALGLVLHLIEISVDGGTLVGGHHFIDIDTLGSQYHESHTKDGVGTGGENQQALVTVGDGEGHFGTLAVANPVALRFLNGFGPLECVQVTQ